jgi:Thiamine pyrophosphate enzyme, C-terminal TPP binding domain
MRHIGPVTKRARQTRTINTLSNEPEGASD